MNQKYTRKKKQFKYENIVSVEESSCTYTDKTLVCQLLDIYRKHLVGIENTTLYSTKKNEYMRYIEKIDEKLKEDNEVKMLIGDIKNLLLKNGETLVEIKI